MRIQGHLVEDDRLCMATEVGKIYKLTSPSGKAYVGQTIQQLSARVSGHRCRSRCYAIGAAIKKYGLRNFKVELLLDNVPFEDLDAEEGRLIAEHGTLSPKGYNLVPGNLGATFKPTKYQKLRETNGTPEFRAHQSSLMKERWSDPAWAAQWRATWLEKREVALEGIEGRERELKLLHHKRCDRQVAKRKAFKDPEKRAEWEEAYSCDAVMHRRRVKNLTKRCEEMASMSTVGGLDHIRKLTESAMKSARRTQSKTTPDEQQRWYPNVLTEAEIAAIRANGGCWPS